MLGTGCLFNLVNSGFVSKLPLASGLSEKSNHSDNHLVIFDVT